MWSLWLKHPSSRRRFTTGPYFVPFANLQDSAARNIPIYTDARSCTILPNFVGCVRANGWAARECLRNHTNHKPGLSLWYTTEKNTCPLLSRRKWSAISWESFHRHGNLSSGSELFSFPIIRVTLVSFATHIGTDGRQTGVARTSSDSVASNMPLMSYMTLLLSCLSSILLSLVT